MEYAKNIASAQQARRMLRFATSNQILDYANEILQSRDRDSFIELDWLLFEVDSDRSIRHCQVETAQAMIQPKDGGNAVMQLNMGEGKSSVRRFCKSY
jgi:hypothetical protein